MATEQGFSNQKKKGRANFKTVHPMGSNSYGQIVSQKQVYDKIATSVTSSEEVLGDDGQVAFWKFDIVFSGAVEGDLFRVTNYTVDGGLSDPSLTNFEFEIVRVDGSYIYVLPIAPFFPIYVGGSISFDGTVLGWVTSKSTPTGEISANVSLPPDGVVETSNSSTTPLGANGVFTGSAFEVLPYSVINVGVFSNVPSATNGVTVQFSPNGVNWDHSHSTTYTAATGVGYIFNVEYRFARVVYTNGATAQASFRLQTIAKVNFVKSSLYTISQAVTGNMFVELGKNVIIGETTAGGGGYVAVKVNPSGALTVENTPTKQTPSYQEIINLTNVAQTFTAPTDAKWCKIQADSTNTAIIRVKIGGTATATSGFQFAANKTEDFYAVGNISVICETAATNQKIYVQFGV